MKRFNPMRFLVADPSCLGMTMASLCVLSAWVEAQTIVHELRGDGPNDGLGALVGGAGDLDGDGYADLAVGGPANSANGGHAGIVKVFSGRDGSVLHVLHGLPGDRFGSSVSGIRDVDGDGFGDLLVGAREANTSNELTFGKIVVFSGLTGSSLYTSIGNMQGAIFGFSCAGGGDVNLDGIPDAIVGAPNDGTGPPPFPTPGPGSARVLSGPNGTTLYEWSGATPTFRLGVQVAMLGDVDGDGHVDLAVVSDFRTDGSFLQDIPVYSGRDGSILYDLGNPALGFTIHTLGRVGDLNRDGYADIAAGLTVGGDNAGTAFVLSGFEHLLGFCAGGGLRRLGVRVPDGAGEASWGPGLSVQGAWSPGDLRRFQVWYRDPAPLSPCGTSFNTTNGIEIVFSL